MTKIAIRPITGDKGEPGFRATAGERHSQGNTAGEALDALRAQMPADRATTLIIVQSFEPDEFFTAEQQQRLSELTALARAASTAGQPLPANQQTELEQLIEAELIASANRANSLATELGK